MIDSFLISGQSKPLLTNRDNLMQRLELFAQRNLSNSRDPVRTDEGSEKRPRSDCFLCMGDIHLRYAFLRYTAQLSILD